MRLRFDGSAVWHRGSIRSVMKDPSPPNAPKFIVVQIGVRLHYGVATILAQAGLLHRLVTDAYAGPGSPLYALRCLPGPLLTVPFVRRAAERSAPISADKIDAHNLLGARYFVKRRFAKDMSSMQHVHLSAANALGQSVLESDIETADAIYGFCLASLSVFKRAHARHKLNVLEQLSAPVRIEDGIMREEHELWGNLVPQRSDADILEAAEIERIEYELATTILAPSDFVARSLEQCGVAQKKIRVVPYGVAPSCAKPSVRRYYKGRPLRLLFVGGVRPQKGAHYLLGALRMLDRRRVQLRLVGPVLLPQALVASLEGTVEFVGQVARSEVVHHYEWADVLVFPSLCDGFGAVICEALQNGLPVITTANAGASMIVEDEVNGYVIPIRDTEAIADRVERFLHCKDRLEQMSQNALLTAKTLTLDAYGERLVKCLEGVT